MDFVRVLLREKLVVGGTLVTRVEALDLPPDRLEVVRSRLRRLQAGP